MEPKNCLPQTSCLSKVIFSVLLSTIKSNSFDYSTLIMYETFFHVTCSPSCINPKVHRTVCAMKVGTDLTWQTNGCFQPSKSSVYIASTGDCEKMTINYMIIKNHSGRGNFVLISRLLRRTSPRLLAKIHATEYM